MLLPCLLVQLAGSQPASGSCDADDRCHFGSCLQKNYAVSNVTHNLANIGCDHPYSIAARTFIRRREQPWFPELELACGPMPVRRPACEIRRQNSCIDVLWVFIFTALVTFKSLGNLEE